MNILLGGYIYDRPFWVYEPVRKTFPKSKRQCGIAAEQSVAHLPSSAMAVIALVDQQGVGINPSKTTSKPLGTAMVHFLPPRCCDCGALPGKEHLSWCPYSEPGVVHESSIEFEPEQTPAESADDGKLRVPTICIDRESLDLEALRPFFTKEGLRNAVQNHLGEFGYQRSISGVVYNYEKPPKEE